MLLFAHHVEKEMLKVAFTIGFVRITCGTTSDTLVRRKKRKEPNKCELFCCFSRSTYIYALMSNGPVKVLF